MSEPYHIYICTSHKPRVFGGGCCHDKGSEGLFEKFSELLKTYQLEDKVKISRVNCLRQCLTGVSVMITPGRVMYGKIQEKDLTQIIEKHLIGHRVVKKLQVKPTTPLLDWN